MGKKGDIDNQIDSLVDYCLYAWGGRLNPIIITDGKDITGDWWDFMQKYDPDVVLSFVDLSEKLIKKIDHFICPMFIQKLEGRDDGRYFVEHQCNGLMMLPNDAYLHWAGRPYELVVFEDKSEDKDINRFLARNFGVYNNLQHTKYALDQVTKKYPYQVSSEETLAAVLQQLSERGNFHTYPMEFLGKWTPMPDVQHEDRTNCFAVVVGDSAQDFAHYWNRQLAVAHHKRASFNQLWLSKKVAKNQKLKEALKALIDKEADWDGGSKRVRFESLSVKQAELEKIAKELTGLFAHPVCEAIEKPRMPFFNLFHEFQEGNDLSPGLEETQQFSLNGEKDIFTVAPPQNIKGYHQGSWVIDLKIGYQPQNYENDVINRELWWKIPRHLGVVGRMFNRRTARVTRSRLPACLCSKNGCTINLELPKEYWLFNNLICDERHFPYGDLRKDLDGKNNYGVETSQQGKNLRGLFGLFKDNFLGAENILCEPFWIDVLYKFCKENPKVHEDLKDRVLKILKRSTTWNEDTVSKIATQCHNYFKGRIDAAESCLTWAEMEELMEPYFKKYKAADKKNTKERCRHYHDRMFDDMEYLIDSDLLLVGVKPLCPKCGKRNWYRIDETKQKLECKSCLEVFPLQAESEWHYKLNALVERAIKADGTVPVLHCLNDLMEDARGSFFYTPSLELFRRKGRKWHRAGDLDVVCIQSGLFVVGEVKASQDSYDEGQIREMIPYLREIKPDVVVFAAPGKLPTSSHLAGVIKDVAAKLADLSIEVRWIDTDEKITLRRNAIV